MIYLFLFLEDIALDVIFFKIQFDDQLHDTYKSRDNFVIHFLIQKHPNSSILTKGLSNVFLYGVSIGIGWVRMTFNLIF